MSVDVTSILSRNVSSLLARMAGTPSAASAVFPDAGNGATPPAPAAAASAAPPAAAASNALTGPSKASVSGEILALLTRLQQLASELNAGGNQPGTPPASTPISAASAQPAMPSTSIAASNAPLDPLSLLISAMDGNGDGAISQSEMETYIQNLGGTAAQADALFAGLNQGNSGSLTHDQLAGDLQQARQVFGGRHGRHHHVHGAADHAIAREMVRAADSNGDNAISKSEFESFVTGLGGTQSEADADFAALDPNSTGSLTTAQLTSAIKAFESAGSAATIATNSASPILTLLDSLQSGASTNGSSTASSSTGTTTNVTA